MKPGDEAIPPPSRTHSLYISLSTHTNFSGPWHVQAGLNAKGALFFSRFPASLNTLGRLATTHGWNCVLVVLDGDMLHSSPLSINTTLISASAIDCELGSFGDVYRQTC